MASQLIYGLNDRPPFFHLALLGLQYLCMMFPYLIIIVIIDRSQNLVSPNPISFSLIALGIAVLLQSIPKGPIGSGFLAPSVVSAIYFPASMTAAAQGGLSLVYGMTIFAGCVEMVFAFFTKWLRKYFPPLVCGLIIIAVGFQLGLLATSQSLAIDLWGHPFYNRHLIAAAVTFFSMIALTIWTKGMLRLLSPFIGIVLGFILSFILNILPSMHDVQHAPWFAFPRLGEVSYSFSLDLSLPFILAAIASSLRVVGGVTSSQKINNPSWNRPDLKQIKKGMIADGMGCFIGGFLGVSGLNMAPSLVGVAYATGATSRAIAYSLAIWLFLLAFLPKIIYIFLAIPLSVMGAALLFTASFMVAGGIDLLTSRKLDSRAILVVGVSLLLGISQVVFPQYFTHLPSFLKMFTNSLLSVVTLSAFLLNLIFRIGVRQKVAMLGTEKSEVALDQWLNEKAKEWDLSKNTVQRLHQSISSLTKQIQHGYLQEGGIQFNLIHDPVEVVLSCKYIGTLPKLRFEADEERGMIEETAFTQGLANYALSIPVDQIKTSTKDNQCFIELQYYT